MSSKLSQQMGICYEKTVRPIFFRMDPEDAHDCVARAMQVASAAPSVCRIISRMNGLGRGLRPVEAFGLKFPNAVGLAAGFDKNASFWPALLALGFGHVEVGTVTFQRQPGNPRPRIFRYPVEESLINRMGFNNDGAERVSRRLKKQFSRCRPWAPLGINIGKSKAAPLDQAPEDYLGSFDLLADFADYFTINISSPNTPDLRALQEGSRLVELLSALKNANDDRALRLGVNRIPMLVKIAPELTYPQIDVVLENISRFGYDGIIATNTTLSRPGAMGDAREDGGLSGRPLRRLSTDIINYISKATSGRLPIVGVGGIHDIEAAGEKIDAGASLVQIYTGMVYRGPFLAKELAWGLSARQHDWWGE